jgi:DNA helicase II / ATP-dependent DNA helicase PcrA
MRAGLSGSRSPGLVTAAAESENVGRLERAAPMAYDYLSDLNGEQRRAVKHSVKDASTMDAKPLLVIAGAGTGKTKTLAHRVAHLIANGVDAHRILLLTFSRRAAFDMTGRVKRITAAALGTRQIDLPWAGRTAPVLHLSAAELWR